MRRTVHINVSSVEQAEAFLGWYNRHASILLYASSNYGCPCCEDSFDLEGPDAALLLLPESWCRPSEWTRGKGESPKTPQVPPRLKLSALSHQARGRR